MLIEKGKVIRLENKAAWVMTAHMSTCNACKAQAGCGQNLMNRLLGSSADIRARIDPAYADLVVGDQVEIGIEEGAVVAASLLAYGLPLLSLILAIWFCESTSLTPVYFFLVCAFALSAGLGLSRLMLRTRFNTEFFEPIILRKVPPADAISLDLL